MRTRRNTHICTLTHSVNWNHFEQVPRLSMLHFCSRQLTKSEGELLGQSVSGLWHLFIFSIHSYADLHVHMGQDSQYVFFHRAATTQSIMYLYLQEILNFDFETKENNKSRVAEKDWKHFFFWQSVSFI